MSAADRKVKMSEDFSGLFASETEVISLAPGDVLFEKGEPGHLVCCPELGEFVQWS